MDRPREHNSSFELRWCPACGDEFNPWITTCPSCETSLTDRRGQSSRNISLDRQAAAPLPPGDEWIDIPIPASEVGKTALLRQFLSDCEVEVAESRRFISIPLSAGDQTRQAIRSWRVTDDQFDDLRHLDTLGSTVAEIVATVILAIDQAVGPAVPRSGTGDIGIDLDLR